MIQRDSISKFQRLLDHFPVVCILGARQVGKTTLSQQLKAYLGKPSVYLDMEYPEDVAKLENPVLYLENLQESCVIIDEVQQRPNLFPVLRSLIDKHRVPARFLILGSASFELLQQSSESLAGRITYSELSALSLNEVGAENQNQLWIRGGFPEPFLMPSDEIRAEWHRSFMSTYVERDLAKLGLSTSSMLLYRFFQMLAGVQGSLLNKQNFSRSLDISDTTVERYIDYCEKAFLLRRLKPYSANVKKRLVKSPKLYIRDTGLLHYLLGVNSMEELQSSIHIGASWESFVMEQICKQLPPHIQPFYYRTQDGTECDLVLVKGDTPLCAIEIKYSSSPKQTKSMTIAAKDLGTNNNYTVVPSNTSPYHLSEQWEVVGLERIINEIKSM